MFWTYFPDVKTAIWVLMETVAVDRSTCCCCRHL